MKPLPRPAGHVLSVVRRLASDPLTALPELRDEVGDAYLVDVPCIKTVVLTHPRDVHAVLVRDARHFRKDYFTRQLADILGDGLLLSEGEVWKRNRRLAQPAFHSRTLPAYGAAMVELADETTATWGARRHLDLHAELMRLTLRIVARTLFGQDIGDDAEVVGAALDAFMRTSLGVLNTGWRLPTWVPTPLNVRHVAALREIDRIVYRMIDAHRKHPDESTLLGMLLAATDAEGRLADQQLRDEAVTLLMAGHETTANALTFVFYLLSQHPNAEARLHAEVDALDDAPGFEDLRRLPYARAVVLETMRLYPPAWSIGREATVDVAVGEHLVPKGVHVWLPQWVVHRDPRWYADPLEFRPERWLDGTLERSLPDCAYFPFGAGSRTCIGKRFAEMEAVLVLAAVARRYALRLAPGETLRLTPSVTLRPTDGVDMIASQRAARRLAA